VGEWDDGHRALPVCHGRNRKVLEYKMQQRLKHISINRNLFIGELTTLETRDATEPLIFVESSAGRPNVLNSLASVKKNTVN
jgi:hypothetical protein